MSTTKTLNVFQTVRPKSEPGELKIKRKEGYFMNSAGLYQTPPKHRGTSFNTPVTGSTETQRIESDLRRARDFPRNH